MTTTSTIDPYHIVNDFDALQTELEANLDLFAAFIEHEKLEDRFGDFIKMLIKKERSEEGLGQYYGDLEHVLLDYQEFKGGK